MQDNGTHNTFHAIVKGKVQGVGFRVFALDSARKNNVHGWVRNLPNGSVEVYAEGDELRLTEFLTDLYRGPVISHVDDIELDWQITEPQFEQFEIRR